MTDVQGIRICSHLPIPPASVAPLHINPSLAGNAPPSAVNVPFGPVPLTIAGKTIQVDVAAHTADGIVNQINALGLAGVKASIDRYGQIVIAGAGGQIGGNANLRALLGLP